jgi:peptide/nickel transport system permease protein
MSETALRQVTPPADAGVRARVLRNWPFAVGLLLLLTIAVLAVAGPSLAPQDPIATHVGVLVGETWVYPPYPPFTVPDFPLGSDRFGRDLLSRLLWGVRPTLILVALVAVIRLVLGLLIGVWAGWSTGAASRLPNALISVALTVPTIIAALAVITAVGVQRGLPAFIIGLAATGWADTARLVSEQTRLLKGQPYVEAARALGASGAEMVFRHILRQITPLWGMLLAFEAGGTLMVVAALGFLGYYIGGAYWVVTGDFSATAVSGSPELGQMLSDSWQILKPWATVATGTLIFIAMLGFNLMGEGLRRQLARPAQRPTHVLGRVFGAAGQWLDEALLGTGGAGRRQAAIGVLALALVAIAMLIWQPWQGSAPELSSTAVQAELPVPGEHLWAAERRDAYGTALVPQSELVTPAVRWFLSDDSGFPGSPVVDAAGNVYVAAKGGHLYALTRAGELLWQASLPAEAVGPLALGVGPDGSRLYVTDGAGGLSAFSLTGEQLWRVRSATGRRASSGPVVAQDGTVYYTVVTRVDAVAPDGTSVWTSDPLPGQGEVTPRLDVEGRWLFVMDAVLDRQTGSLVDFSAVVPPGQAGINAAYIIGGDGKTYLREGHGVYPWEMSAEGPQRTGQITWNWQAATIFLPYDAGVSGQGRVWLFYGSGWDDLRYVMLSADSRLLLHLRYPQRSPRLIALDAAGRSYICGSDRANLPECLVVSEGLEEPIWRLGLERGSGIVTGGALVPGRLYVTTEDGYFFAIGEP